MTHTRSASLLQATASSSEGGGPHGITPQDFSIFGIPQGLHHRFYLLSAQATSLSKANVLFWKFGHF